MFHKILKEQKASVMEWQGHELALFDAAVVTLCVHIVCIYSTYAGLAQP